jgi:3-phenylpropionate/cinnamic acid dioxygenase small subunit
MSLCLVDPRLQQEIEQFLYYEAALLDDRRYQDWFALLADDLHYWMPIRSTRTAREIRHEVAGRGDSAFFDETKALMAQRITKLGTGMSWAEDPPSRTRHLVSNVRITPVSDTEYDVDLAFTVYRSRLERDVVWFVGRRQDRLRRTDQTEVGWQIVTRKIVLDQTTLAANNLSIFF